MNNSERKKVFFLGSGFSKAIVNNCPLLGDLTKIIDENIAKDNTILRAFYEEIPVEIRSNIELLMTYLSANIPFKNTGEKAISLALYEDILFQLSIFFSNLANDNYWNNCNTLLRDLFLKYIYKNLRNLEFITLNYDIVLERFFWSTYNNKVFPKRYNDYNDPAPSLDEFYKYRMLGIKELYGNYSFRSRDINYPSIIKLHGSANWLWNGTSTTAPIYHRDFYNEEQININVFSGLKPFIIPPTLDKESFYNHDILKFLWEKARSILENAEEIHIVGFSFPQTDYPVRFLFQDTLKKSNAKIFVINKACKEELSQNYNAVFNGYKNINYEYTGSEDSLYNFLSNKLETE